MARTDEQLKVIEKIISELKEFDFDAQCDEENGFYENGTLYDLRIMMDSVKKIIRWRTLLNKEGI